MTLGGWIVMTLSVSAVTVLFVWCIWKVLSIPGESEKLHSIHDRTDDR